MPDTFDDILGDADTDIMDSLGRTGTIVDKGPLVGVFENEPDYETGQQGANPAFTYVLADAAFVVVRSDALVLGAVSYTVHKNEPDGTGLSKLILSEN